MTPKSFFHKVSYLQYVFILAAGYFYIPFIISLIDNQPDFQSLNGVLVFMGISISFSTLQNTQTTQNKFSKNIWQSPRKGKIFIVTMASFTAMAILGGLVTYFQAADTIAKDLSMGILLFGIGLLGMLKSAIEMFENHRLDKNPPRP